MKDYAMGLLQTIEKMEIQVEKAGNYYKQGKLSLPVYVALIKELKKMKKELHELPEDYFL